MSSSVHTSLVVLSVLNGEPKEGEDRMVGGVRVTALEEEIVVLGGDL